MDSRVTKVSLKWFRILKWVGLVVGCSAKFVTGSLFVINVYEGAIKDTFNYTQKELNLQASLLNIGLGVGFVPGMFYDKFGPQWTSCAGLVVSVAGYLLLWSTTKHVTFYTNHSGLMAFYFFICGFGSVFTYMVALNTNVINFHSEHRGKIVGLLNAFFAGSPSIFAVIYYQIISKQNGGRNTAESFSKFMLSFAILFGIVDFICLILLRIYKSNDFDTEELIPEESISSDVKDSARELRDVSDEGKNKDTCFSSYSNNDGPSTLLQILKNLDFYIFSSAVTCASVTGLVFNVVLTQTTKSLKLSDHDQELVIIVPIVNACVSLLIGIFSDYFKSKFPRMLILILGCLSFITCQVLSVTLSDKYAFLALASVFCGIGVGILWSIAPTIMSEYFHVSNLGRNWGMALFLASLVGLAAQVSFGAVYDEHVPSGNLYCYGMQCIRGGHAIVLGFAVLSIILSGVLYVKRHVKLHRN